MVQREGAAVKPASGLCSAAGSEKETNTRKIKDIHSCDINSDADIVTGITDRERGFGRST
jgi:putative methionine-R-sulfoxide reductase with GAF domain